MKYVSEETGEAVTIECRMCRKFDDEQTEAVALAGQWEGGDNDVDPHWVPVCAGHLARWFRADQYDSGLIPAESRLPVFMFALSPSRVEIDPYDGPVQDCTIAACDSRPEFVVTKDGRTDPGYAQVACRSHVGSLAGNMAKEA